MMDEGADVDFQKRFGFVVVSQLLCDIKPPNRRQLKTGRRGRLG